MIYKLITFKLSLRNIVRLVLLFMASNEDLNMKAKKVRTFLYLVNFLFREHQQKTFVTLSRFWLLMVDDDDSVIS